MQILIVFLCFLLGVSPISYAMENEQDDQNNQSIIINRQVNLETDLLMERESKTIIKTNNQCNPILESPILNVMNALNQLPLYFPYAISLASGRPSDEFCNPEIATRAIDVFKDYVNQHSMTPINRLLGQYGKTSGIINDILSRHLKIDENIEAEPESIIVTVGFQEAAALCAMTLFDKDDVLLVPDPVFIGITGIATLYGVNIEPISYEENLELAEIKETLENIRKAGKNPKALYIISDFSNPQGSRLSLEERNDLLSLAKEQDFFIIEDNAYSMFYYNDEKIPSLKSLDKDKRVIYLGSFAKSLYPALRMGYVVADQHVTNREEKLVSLAGEMTKVKSFITVNTPAFDQAVVGGVLIQNNYSLNTLNEEKRKYYKHNRDVMIQTLSDNFKDYTKEVKWNSPNGGFFLTVSLPFSFTQAMIEECARNYNVIVFPVSLLSLNQKPNNKVRLAFTNVPPDELEIAVNRFSEFVRSKIIKD